MIPRRRCRRHAQAGSGKCVLIVSSVKVIIRQTDSAIASDAATAWVNLEDATGVGFSAKPGPEPRDRDMVVFPSLTGESPATHNLPTRDGKIWAATASN